jgi:hypothetical protein
MLVMEMFDFTAETPISMQEAVKLLPRRENGKTVSIQTIIRWIMAGHHGVFLEGNRFGGAICTSAESLRRFSVKCMALTSAEQQQPKTKANRTAAKERAKKRLRQRGYMSQK